MRKIMIPFVLTFLLLAGVTPAQDIPDEIKSNSLYSNSKDIINGTKWLYEKKYRGSPFVAGNNWFTGTVKYNGNNFTDVRLNYDLYTNEFIVFSSEEGNKKFVVLPNEYLESFYYVDTVTNRTRYFEYLQLPGTKEKKLYEIAYKGESVLFIRHVMAVRSKVENGLLGDYISSVDMYVKTNDKYESFSKKNALLIILGKHIPELKKFIRKNKLKINKRHYKNVAPLIEYYDKLEAL